MATLCLNVVPDFTEEEKEDETNALGYSIFVRLHIICIILLCEKVYIHCQNTLTHKYLSIWYDTKS